MNHGFWPSRWGQYPPTDKKPAFNLYRANGDPNGKISELVP